MYRYCCRISYLDGKSRPQEVHRHLEDISTLLSWADKVVTSLYTLNYIVESKTCSSGVPCTYINYLD